MDLADFVLARLDDDELFASEAVQRLWYATDNFIETHEGGEVGRFEISADARHAAAWDPPRVLAEVAAKRSIVQSYQDHVRWHNETGGAAREYEAMMGVKVAIAALARLHIDHPDFNPAWMDDSYPPVDWSVAGATH